MSRLDSAIRRLIAQKTVLEWALGEVRDLDGVIFEIGLGNGRTYDHLRTHARTREIYVFERKVAAHPDCIPEAAYLVLGDVTETLPQTARRFGGRVALAHLDIGTGDKAANIALTAELAPSLAQLLCPGGLLVSDQSLPEWEGARLPLPGTVKEGRIHLYRPVALP